MVLVRYYVCVEGSKRGPAQPVVDEHKDMKIHITDADTGFSQIVFFGM